METAIRWSPNSTSHEQRFLVVDVNGHSFKRCTVEEYNGKKFQHRTLSTYSKGPPFRAFDWAPHDETLVAVGQWSGEVAVLRIDDASPIQSLPAKHQRLCNAVAFSRTGLLAAGLERAEVLVAGVKGRGIRIFDLRENTGNPSLHFKTDSVYNIAIDPLDENYFACAGAPKDPLIQIWDRRSGSPYTAASIGSGSDSSTQPDHPVLEYKVLSGGSKGSAKAQKWDGSGPMLSNIWSVKYCKVGHPDFENMNESDNSVFTRRIHQIERAYDHERNNRHESERIVAFDFSNLAGSKGRPCAIILRGDHSIGVVELDGVPSALSVSSMGGVLVGKVNNSNPRYDKPMNGGGLVTNTIREFYPPQRGLLADSLATLRERGNIVGYQQLDLATQIRKKPVWSLRSSRECHERMFETQFSGTNLTMEEALMISTVARRRCEEGYLFDYRRNVEILRDDPWLQKLWRWVGRAKSNAEDEGMVADAFDLSFFGVANIWNNDLGKPPFLFYSSRF
ncbi:hypothetical protein P7C71_g3771, partial [Lecanoromycetidae sp. Uapishka_2]